ncbi:MAG: hypothetical protein EAZ74_04580 [Alphaproteobacteria bacterium]|nr:MAG: hypothetical protein EAY76_06125 [Alphaproteobacteria bacterium]TAF14178.1 MAG: hypothetical protein EAZ74_04580 [Alphaproteobacteria bacterium]TAF39161.1 MAG: hypothetical protein EAZ66_05210 [Alphaproteobacteria bacterium]TAF74954.1 MAG: hypothetical protein EAZ52_07845 [Alphaproteobacteria bacterium]
MIDPLSQSEIRSKLRDDGIRDPSQLAVLSSILSSFEDLRKHADDKIEQAKNTNHREIEQAQQAIKDDIRDNFGDYVREWVKRNLLKFIVSIALFLCAMFQEWIRAKIGIK